jgi:hypothetical protein
MPRGGTKEQEIEGTIEERPDNAHPGEAVDHVDEFERRIETLTGIAESAEFESGSLLGDIRDTIVEIFKHRPKPWSQMSEAEQRDMARGIEQSARTLVRKIVVVVAEEDLVSVQATLKGYSAKGGTFKLNAEARGDEETARLLFEMDGHEFVIMSADATRFLGQKGDAAVQPDAPALPFSDPPAEGSENDEDLVDAADEEADQEENADVTEEAEA